MYKFHTNLPRFQGARPDHVRVESSSCCFPSELVSFVRPRELVSFDPWHVTPSDTFGNPTSHKSTTIKTLTRRAQLVCNTPDSLSDENKYLRRVFDKNNYKDDFIRRNAHRPTETNANSTPTTTATIPYVRSFRPLASSPQVVSPPN